MSELDWREMTSDDAMPLGFQCGDMSDDCDGGDDNETESGLSAHDR